MVKDSSVRTVLLVATICGSLASIARSSNADTESDREKFGLKGPVKSVSERIGRVIHTRQGSVEECCTETHRVAFDMTGKATAVQYFIGPIDDNSDQNERAKKRYDDYGRLVEEVQYRDDGSILTTIVYVYGTSDQPLEVLHHSSVGDLYRKEVFTYDAQDNLLTRTVYYGDSRRASRYELDSYDAHGNWRKMTLLDWNKRDAKWEAFSIIYRDISYH